MSHGSSLGLWMFRYVSFFFFFLSLLQCVLLIRQEPKDPQILFGQCEDGGSHGGWNRIPALCLILPLWDLTFSHVCSLHALPLHFPFPSCSCSPPPSPPLQIHEDLGIVEQRPCAKHMEISLPYFKGPAETGWSFFDPSSIS